LKERVLIAVKTYPVLSDKYIELVCTAGFREDGSWIRIYPSPFRFLEDTQRYRKYQWIELDLVKNTRDKRPESYSPTNIDAIELLDVIPPGGHWEERRKLILDRNIIHTNLATIKAAAKNDEYSLVIFKPSKILDVIAKPAEDKNWKVSKEAAATAALAQGSLFKENVQTDYRLMPKLPYKFSYKFEDDEGKSSTLMIEDWEIGQLYWNCRKRYNEAASVEKVREKYFNDFALTKDLFLFLGTTYEWHVRRAPNPYVVIGTFHPGFPPTTGQLSLL
jgi:hypothetical protein